MAQICSCHSFELVDEESGRVQLRGKTHRASTHDRPLKSDDYGIPTLRRRDHKGQFDTFMGTVVRVKPRTTRTGLLSPLHGSPPRAPIPTIAVLRRRLRRATVQLQVRAAKES